MTLPSKAPCSVPSPTTMATFGDLAPVTSGESAVPVATPSLAVATVAGSVAAGALSVTITNQSGSVVATVAGAALAVGKTVSWTAANGGRLGAIAYDPGASGSLLISAVR